LVQKRIQKLLRAYISTDKEDHLLPRLVCDSGRLPLLSNDVVAWAPLPPKPISIITCRLFAFKTTLDVLCFVFLLDLAEVKLVIAETSGKETTECLVLADCVPVRLVK